LELGEEFLLNEVAIRRFCWIRISNDPKHTCQK